ncbi:PREDICTED: probable oligoribonuclease [Eufriesea mexicana]|uniref:probable oligoribonuclease n=1 Tax=Eufriesea mexicana TaxID=516756 RepID=UPI00083C142F|nr:PREDICTED: probable oligoribonuclease [Eufriesea mexicana]XP_017754145.1 PREDICTED: probable oligoribonuclease [Eufriesea mexicana]
MYTIRESKDADSQCDYIVWIDLELTGLNIETDTILEIACLITNKDLDIVSEPFNVVIHHPAVVLENMNEWCTYNLPKCGLVQESKDSKISLKDAEQMLLDFLNKHIPSKVCPLAGNTIYMDRLFLIKLMPSVNDYLHYRIIDVSSIKELVRRWYGKQFKKDTKLQHRALPDIKNSIKELKYYKKNVFIPPT